MIQETGANVLVLEQSILQMQIGQIIKMSSIRQIELRVGRAERVNLTNGKFKLTKENAEWNQIFNNFKASVETELGIEKLIPNDVEAIYLTPAKISKDNSTDPDKHVDCNVEIEAKNVVTVTVKLQDAGAPTFQIRMLTRDII